MKKKQYMVLLEQINGREVLYINVRTDQNWFAKLPFDNWIVLTIANLEDRELLGGVVAKCLDSQVNYICCAGQLAEFVEDLFDEEIVYRAIEEENKTGKFHDYKTSPMTTMHGNLDDGFWFATTLAYDEHKNLDKVVCLDLTILTVKEQLSELIIKMVEGWIPPATN